MPAGELAPLIPPVIEKAAVEPTGTLTQQVQEHAIGTSKMLTVVQKMLLTKYETMLMVVFVLPVPAVLTIGGQAVPTRGPVGVAILSATQTLTPVGGAT